MRRDSVQTRAARAATESEKPTPSFSSPTGSLEFSGFSYSELTLLSASRPAHTPSPLFPSGILRLGLKLLTRDRVVMLVVGDNPS